jgi:hypothetical protein
MVLIHSIDDATENAKWIFKSAPSPLDVAKKTIEKS